MSGWPGWNSANDASWWSGFFFWCGAASFLALGASALLSHAYGSRKDRLLESAGTAVQQVREPISTGAPIVSGADTWGLSTTQTAAVEAACRPFPGQTFELQSVNADAATLAFRTELEAALIAAGWKAVPSTVAHAEFSRMPVGIVFILNKAQVEKAGNNLPAAVQELIVALHDSGAIPSIRSVVLNESVPNGSVRLVIGSKP